MKKNKKGSFYETPCISSDGKRQKLKKYKHKHYALA